MLSLRECGICCHQNKQEKGREILPMRRKTYPSSFCGNPSWCRLRGLVQLGTLHIVKIGSWRQKNNCTLHARQPKPCVLKIFESYLPRNECLLWRGLESSDWIILEYSGPWSLEAEVTSKGAQDGERFTEVSLRRQRAHICRAWSLRIIKQRLIAVYFSPSLLITVTASIFSQKEARKRKMQFLLCPI